jgi:poly(A) polymerase
MAGETENASKTQLARQPWMGEAPVTAVVTALADAGGSPRFVGGCVRDTILNRPIHDIDIATLLPPEEVQNALQAASVKYVSPGFDHGTITAILPDQVIEVTTLRRDVATDGRHAQVAYTDNWREDAMRRDFTMNALFLSDDGLLIDYTGGFADAKAGRVKFVGSATDRIQEDYLRILRYFRFMAHYGKGEPEREALDACRINAAGLENLSGERLAKEFFRLLEAQDPVPALRLMEN